MIQIITILGLVIIFGGDTNQVVELVFDALCLAMLFFCVKNSQSRWKAFGCALGAMILVFALGMLSALILVPAHGSIIDVNEVLNKVDRAIAVAAPLAAIWATSLIPVRKKA